MADTEFDPIESYRGWLAERSQPTQGSGHDSRHALVYLRGRGEGGWISHHAAEARLRSTPTGLECALGNLWHEAERQGRRGVLLLGDSPAELTELVASEEALGERARDRLPVRLRFDAAVPSGLLVDWIAATLPRTMERTREIAVALRERGELLLLIDGLPDGEQAPDQLLEALGEDASNRCFVTGPYTLDGAATKLGGLLFEVQLPSRGTNEHPTLAGEYELLSIPGGSFRMGSADDDPDRWGDEGPVRDVRVAPFRLGRFPVTNADFARFLADRSAEPPPGYWCDARFNAPEQPVVGVGYEEALRFADWAGLRLPSEAEWEYACRAGSTGQRYGKLDEIAWHAGNSEDGLRPVGGRRPNAFGLHDMLGDAWEWVADERHDSYMSAPTDGSAWIDGADDPPRRILRGGSWADNPRTVRATTRLTDHPGPRIGNVGLRLAAD